MSFDRADWHYSGNYPADLPTEAASTHIGMFFAWVALHGLAGQLHTEEGPDELRRLTERTITPGFYVRAAMDEKFWPEDLSEEGIQFADAYYRSNGYYNDLARITEGLPSIYHLPDSWESYERVAPLIEEAFNRWKAEGAKTEPPQ